MADQLSEALALPGARTVPASRSSARHRMRSLELWAPLGILAVIAFACYVWPVIVSIPSPTLGVVTEIGLPLFSPGHLLGTNLEGVDMLSRVLYGGRVSLEVGVGATLLGLLVGGTLGSVAAYFGGITEVLLMRALDVIIAVPSLVLVLVFAEYLGPGELNVIYAISFFNVAAFARLAHSGTLKVRQYPFIAASRLSGTTNRMIIVKHIVPNVVPQLFTFSFITMAVTILLEAALSYLGLGVQPPNPSWGNMISEGQTSLSSMPALVLIPSAFLFVTVICLNLVGDALRARAAQR